MPVVGGFGCGELQHAVGEDVEVVAVAVGQHDDDGAAIAMAVWRLIKGRKIL